MESIEHQTEIEAETRRRPWTAPLTTFLAMDITTAEASASPGDDGMGVFTAS